MYDIIYADPPWPYTVDLLHTNQARDHYALMTADEIAALPVRRIANTPAVLFLWATSPKMDLAIDTMRAWGFHYRGVGFLWVKTSNAGNILQGWGVRPSFTKMPAEFLLVGSTERKGRTFPILSEGLWSVLLHPRGEHSSKPSEIRDDIRYQLFKPGLSYLELFAREKVAGWDAWGNEVASDIVFP